MQTLSGGAWFVLQARDAAAVLCPRVLPWVRCEAPVWQPWMHALLGGVALPLCVKQTLLPACPASAPGWVAWLPSTCLPPRASPPFPALPSPALHHLTPLACFTLASLAGSHLGITSSAAHRTHPLFPRVQASCSAWPSASASASQLTCTS